MKSVAILAITKSGISTGLKLCGAFPEWSLHAPDKFRGGYDGSISWYAEPTPSKIAGLFADNDGLVCIFSLGATIRLIAPHLKDKKTDPAVIVIDEMANFVISVLSGHIGGANRLAESAAARLGAQPVITTAADVKKTIAVDMVGRDLGWVIEDDGDVTAVSALMVNGERIGVYQDAGRRDWWDGQLPANVFMCKTLEELEGSDASAHLIISDRAVGDGTRPRVVYRPPSLIVGIGLHQGTTAETITGGIHSAFGGAGLSTRSIAAIASLKKPVDVPGLAEAAEDLKVPLSLLGREQLAGISVPNPSATVQSFEGTHSVSEAAAIAAGSNECRLILEKQKFPPDLTVAVARLTHR